MLPSQRQVLRQHCMRLSYARLGFHWLCAWQPLSPCCSHVAPHIVLSEAAVHFKLNKPASYTKYLCKNTQEVCQSVAISANDFSRLRPVLQWHAQWRATRFLFSVSLSFIFLAYQLKFSLLADHKRATKIFFFFNLPGDLYSQMHNKFEVFSSSQIANVS